MVIPLLIEVNPTRVTKSARVFLRAGLWRVLASSEGDYKLMLEYTDPPQQGLELDCFTFKKDSKEFKVETSCYAQVEIIKSSATSLNILAERY